MLRNGSKCLISFPSEEEKLLAADVIIKVFRNKGYKVGVFDVRVVFLLFNTDSNYKVQVKPRIVNFAAI